MPQRRLAAIMFTDIAGYTAMMQEDEARAIELRQRHREVFEQQHKAHRGQIVQYYGDGTLSVFDSAIDAAACAVAMQRAFAEPPEVPLRIGIHSGDILITETEVIGDGVNLASRVESMAVPGSVLVSEMVYDSLKNQADFPAASLGIFTFKNVSKPIEVLALSCEGLAVPDPRKLSGKFLKRQSTDPTLWQRLPVWAQYGLGLVGFLILAPFIYSPITSLFEASGQERGGIELAEDRSAIPYEEKRTFLVTQFENVSGDSSLNWLGHAAPHVLSLDWDQDPYTYNLYDPIGNLKSIKESIDQARQSQLQYILGGQVDKTDETYRLTIELTPVSQAHRKQRYSFEGDDLLGLMDKVSLAVKDSLGIPKAHLSQVTDLPIRQFLTDRPAAFEQFGKAFNRALSINMPNIRYLEQALEEDSTFAWAAYQIAKYQETFQFSHERAMEYIQQARRHRQRLPDFLQANVNQLYYRLSGQPEEALRLSKLFVEIEPEIPAYHSALISESYRQGKYELTLSAINDFLKLTGENPAMALVQAKCHLMLGNYREGLRVMDRYLSQNSKEAAALLLQFELLLGAEEYEAAEKVLADGRLLFPESVTFDHFQSTLAFMRDKDKVEDVDLSTYVGDYRMVQYAPYRASIRLRDGQLRYDADTQPESNIYPTEEPNQFITVNGVSLSFRQDTAYEVIGGFLLRYGEGRNYRTFQKVDSSLSAVIDAVISQDEAAMQASLDAMPEEQVRSRFGLRYRQAVQAHLAWKSTQQQQGTLPLLEGLYANEGYQLIVSVDSLNKVTAQSPGAVWVMDPVVLLPLGENRFLSNINLDLNYEFKQTEQQVTALHTYFSSDTSQKAVLAKVPGGQR